MDEKAQASRLVLCDLCDLCGSIRRFFAFFTSFAVNHVLLNEIVEQEARC